MYSIKFTGWVEEVEYKNILKGDKGWKIFGIKLESWGKAILPGGNKYVAHLLFLSNEWNTLYPIYFLSIKLRIGKRFCGGRNDNNSRMLLIAKHHYFLTWDWRWPQVGLPQEPRWITEWGLGILHEILCTWTEFLHQFECYLQLVTLVQQRVNQSHSVPPPFTT